jgi:hypothetical protein
MQSTKRSDCLFYPVHTTKHAWYREQTVEAYVIFPRKEQEEGGVFVCRELLFIVNQMGFDITKPGT